MPVGPHPDRHRAHRGLGREEVGEHGLFVQAYNLAPTAAATPVAYVAGGVGGGEALTFAGSIAWIHERATVT
jgi:hypothetical protein